MRFSNILVDYFRPIMKQRNLPFNAVGVTQDERVILTEMGLPNKILDFDFENEILLNSNTELIIGKTLNDSTIRLQITSRKIIKDVDCFLASSLSNFVRQMYVYDRLWEVSIKNSELGPYRNDRNHKKYARHLESQLLEIDNCLLENDNHYFWGSLIEDIDFGIVG